MIRRTVVFALGLALVATLAIPSGPVFAVSVMSSSLETVSSPTGDGGPTLWDRLEGWTTDMWLWLAGTTVFGTKSGTEREPIPVEESDGLTGQSAALDPNGLD